MCKYSQKVRNHRNYEEKKHSAQSDKSAVKGKAVILAMVEKLPKTWYN